MYTVSHKQEDVAVKEFFKCHLGFDRVAVISLMSFQETVHIPLI